MKNVLSVALVGMAALCVLPAQARKERRELLEVYTARLSSRDHFSSKGERLRKVAEIIRQDRANFHKYDRRDLEDEGDGYFDSADNRAALERMLERGSCSASARRSIVNGTPLIRVKVYTGYIQVVVL